MAIDQRDVSSTLRFMDDRALQQYAAMHKNDPYIFPLAFQESQNRQRLRMSQQGAQGMQPQPKVADQALAQMMPQPMPEDVGIGALPAPNMTMAAEGGIMGYEGYDEGPSDFGQGPVMMMAGGGVARYNGTQGSFVGGSAMNMPEMLDPEFDDYGNPRPRREREAIIERNAALQAQLSNAQTLGGMRENRVQSLGSPLPVGVAEAYSQFYKPRRAPEAIPKTGLAVQSSATQPVTTPKDEAAPKVDTGRGDTTRKDTERKETGRKETGRKDERKDSSAKTDTGGLDSIINSYTRALDLGIGANKNALVELAANVEQTPKTRAERNAKERAKEGDVFAGREARLAEREKGIEGMGDKYLGLALLQAGAAMMSTPGNIGTVLGKGIAVGSERYIAGIDKINAAKDKFAEARDRLEDLRLNRADMTKKEVREDQRAIDDGILQAKKLLADGATNDLKISADAQTKIFGAVADNFQTDKRLTSAEGIARLQANTANRPGAEMQAVERIMKEKNIPFTEALALYKNTQREGVSEEKLRADWLDQAKRLQIAQDYPNVKTFEDYKTVMGMGGGAGDFKVVGVRPAK